MIYIEMPDLSENKSVNFRSPINGTMFGLKIRWDEFSNCAVLDFFDDDGNTVNTGIFLTNKTVIRGDTRVLPVMQFDHKDGLYLEPTPETFRNYVLKYENSN